MVYSFIHVTFLFNGSIHYLHFSSKVMAVTRISICKSGMAALSRGYMFVYFISIFLYYWVFSTPVVSLVFGCYLYICINWFHLHFDEAFSSLRIANYKSFTRFHITRSGNLEVYTIAVDKVCCWFLTALHLLCIWCISVMLLNAVYVLQ
mgnify:FL=1